MLSDPISLAKHPSGGPEGRTDLMPAANRFHLFLLFIAALAPRLYLLRRFDIELSNDGFDAVRTVAIVQQRGFDALPRDLVDRFILHPLYMALLGVLRFMTPASADFYLAARLLSALLGCVAVLVMFLLARSALDAVAAWAAALLLAFAPTFLWESAAILSSTLFLVLYLAVLLALQRGRYRWAVLCAVCAALTRYEGIVLIALAFLVLGARDIRARRVVPMDWVVSLALASSVPIIILGAGSVATGEGLQFIHAQSMAAIWLRFMAPAGFVQRGSFFLTQYSSLFPRAVVWLGLAGCLVSARWRPGVCALLLLTSALYLAFFEVLVWFNYTTLEVRFLMYPGLPLLVFAGAAFSTVASLLAAPWLPRVRMWLTRAALAAVLVVLLALGYRQAEAGIRFVYTMHATQEHVATELARFVPAQQPTNVMIYAGVSGALDMFARQRGMELSLSFFRFVPDNQCEQFLADNHVQFLVYPIGNAFATAKYPYLARAESQEHGGVLFEPLDQFTTQPDKQVYIIWRVTSDRPD